MDRLSQRQLQLVRSALQAYSLCSNLGNNLGLVWGCMMPYKIMPIRKGLYEALQNGYPVTWTSNGKLR